MRLGCLRSCPGHRLGLITNDNTRFSVAIGPSQRSVAPGDEVDIHKDIAPTVPIGISDQTCRVPPLLSPPIYGALYSLVMR